MYNLYFFKGFFMDFFLDLVERFFVIFEIFKGFLDIFLNNLG